ncbi:MAG: biotin/lipoyl-binding protein [Candidatus Omnitrophica bacterium]|nr:biotin/lipoyl-binding protein [Candidatus Omnitrophota bacterium]
MIEVVVPEVSEEVKQLIVSYWHFEEGDHVDEGVDVVELATEKATFNIAAPSTGVIKEIFFEEGDIVSIGDILAVVEEDEE